MTEGKAPPQSAWYVVALLCLMSVLSYLDRYIIALLAEPLKQSMNIDATQVGLLIGVGFGLVYSVAGLPLANLLDTRARVGIIAASVALWSLCTITSAFAPSYTLLLFSRVGVAIGEAVLVPAAVSMIGDLYAANRRTLPIATFMAVGSLMGAGAFLIGGLAFELATSFSDVISIEPWRLTLVIVGAPGLVLASIWLMTVAEPARDISIGAEAEHATWSAAATYLRRHWTYYPPLLAGLGVSAIGTYSFISWATSLLVNSYGLSVGRAGSLFGTVGLLAGGAAALFWPAVSNWLTRSGLESANPLLLAGGLGGAHLTLACLGVLDTVGATAVAIGMIVFGQAAAGTLAVLILQSAAPSRMRARITSLYVLMANLVGLTMGPPLSAWISQHVFDGPDAIRSALSLIGAVVCPISVLMIVGAAPSYGRALREVSAPSR